MREMHATRLQQVSQYIHSHTCFNLTDKSGATVILTTVTEQIYSYRDINA